MITYHDMIILTEAMLGRITINKADVKEIFMDALHTQTNLPPATKQMVSLAVNEGFRRIENIGDL